jgi:uncharacterized membrane protein YdcZ (DUF606 family)
MGSLGTDVKSWLNVLSSKVKCRACGAMLRQNPKWNWIGNVIVCSFVILPAYLAVFQGLSARAAVVMIIVSFLVGLLLWPYVSKYETDPKHDNSKQET